MFETTNQIRNVETAKPTKGPRSCTFATSQGSGSRLSTSWPLKKNCKIPWNPMDIPLPICHEHHI